MGTEPSSEPYRVDYRLYPRVTQARIDEVADHYRHLTGRTRSVRGLIAVVTQIHSEATERLMDEVFEAIGVDDLLAVLRDTFRGEPPRIPEARRRAQQEARTHPAAPAPEPVRAPEPAMPPSSPPPSPSSHETGAPPSRSQGDPAPPPPPSEWFDGTEDWPVRPPKLDPDGFIEGVIYTPESRPLFDPTSKQRWDRRYWEHEAAIRAETGDLTLWAKLFFWDLLLPEDRVLPDSVGRAPAKPS